MTDDEISRLLAVAGEHDRRAWYLAAALADLRRGDLERLTWADVDFEQGVIAIRGGKAKRVDLIPLHPQLAEELKTRLASHPATPTARVFPRSVTTRTVLEDFVRAGIARREVVRDERGEPVMIREGNDRHPKMKITTEDEQGRVIDLHAMRTTLGTRLAQAGVTPQVAQKIMRHSDYRTTLRHYTVLGPDDASAALERIAGIAPVQSGAAVATGTDNASPIDADSALRRRQQRERVSVRNGAATCGEGSLTGDTGVNRKSLVSAGKNDDLRADASECGKAGDRVRTGNIQLGRLMLYQLSYARLLTRHPSRTIRLLATR